MMWILLLALGGVVVFYGAVIAFGSKRVECPSCDLYIHKVDVGEGNAVLCPHCRAYATATGGKVVKTPPDRIAKEPVFCIELPDRVQWPEGCCVCGAPATREITATLEIEQDGSLGRNVAVGVASLGMLKAVDRTTFTLPVPHCAQHADGAALVPAAEPEALNHSIAFRSYPYFSRFLELNRTTPRRASAWGPSAGGE